MRTSGILLALLGCVSAVPAGDIRLALENDVEVSLHEDKTWSCAPADAREKVSEMSVTLEDGQVVNIAADGTWKFAKPEPPSASSKKGAGLTMVYHVGLAQAVNGQEAADQAMQTAVKGLAKRLRPVVGNKVREEELCACIQSMQKDVEQQEKVVENYFEVRVKVTLDKEAISGIRECCELSVRLEEKTNQEKKGK